MSELDGSIVSLNMTFNVNPNRFCLVHQQDEDDSKEVHEVAIVCFPETDSELSLSKLTFTVKAALIFTSVLFLILTLYIYFRLAELRETQVCQNFHYSSAQSLNESFISGQSHNSHSHQPDDFPLLPRNPASRSTV